ncbi:kinesin family member 22 [Nematocida sp. LUAm3]|nr:kinesin family member 22 [Nematocida sp. LUAm3]KAI5175220.1 kinesin family member 22 [Nematocida sp. LUAm2]KAI5178108.1 kinesin family member 22 [Nematocida sp. LUAm1]
MKEKSLNAHIRTVLRIKPSEEEETIKVIGNKVSFERQKQDILFAFDAVYAKASQEKIYQEIEPFLDNITRGVNLSVLAYGATGSGKTYTMAGTSKHPGIIQRVASFLLGKYKDTLSYLFNVSISLSYIEIYNEKVYDLLGEKDPLPVREDASGNVSVVGLEEKKLESLNEFLYLLQQGVTKRRVSHTSLNKESSRSHSVLTLYVTLLTDSSKIRTKINLVDLAGNENNKRTDNKGHTMVESANINRSLFILHKVVESLIKEEKRIPYRDSKLTRVLSDSLGGSSQCIFIVNVHPAPSPETLSTLSFAAKTRKIKQHVTQHAPYNAPYNVIQHVTHTAQYNGASNGAGRVPKCAVERVKKRAASARKEQKKYKTEELMEILNSKQFLLIKTLPMIGDTRAQQILNYSSKCAFVHVKDLLTAGIPKKIVESISRLIPHTATNTQSVPVPYNAPVTHSGSVTYTAPVMHRHTPSV